MEVFSTCRIRAVVERFFREVEGSLLESVPAAVSRALIRSRPRPARWVNEDLEVSDEFRVFARLGEVREPFSLNTVDFAVGSGQ
ncbi:hypothetical protein ACFYPC_10945 [Streptomyces sp. NPDC005808]|uniref:hypothetical protein n=1 Tax=Streptomyces sp. NPDC005808 TaxID=3364734 RepID=UPI0036A00CD1